MTIQRAERALLHCVCVTLLAVASFAGAQVVEFPDANLEAVIREAISKPTGDILRSDLVGAGFDQLFAESRGISNLTGLEHCTDLYVLYLFDNNISDISVLASLTKLAQLHLGSWEGGTPSPASRRCRA